MVNHVHRNPAVRPRPQYEALADQPCFSNNQTIIPTGLSSLFSVAMSTIMRTLRNLRKIGIRDYLHQMQYIGDTKAGTYIATDSYGNKYYENLEQELPCTPLISP